MVRRFPARLLIPQDATDPSPIQDIVARRFRSRGGLSDEIVRDSQFLERAPQVLHDGIKMLVTESHLVNETFVCRAHRSPGITLHAAKGIHQKQLLMTRLPLHVNAVKKPLNAIVGQYFLVKEVNCRVDGSFTTQFLI